MRKKTFFGAAGVALVAGLLSLTPTACGGGGGIGIGIATIGISAIFSGTSPGWNVRDPNQTPTDGQVSTISPTAEPSIVVTPGNPVDRVVIAGGNIAAVTIRGQAAGTAANATLRVRLLGARWSDTDSAAPEFGPAAVDTVIGAANLAFNVTFDLSNFVAQGTNFRVTGLGTNPGDQFVIRFEAVNAQVTILTTAIDAAGQPVTRIDFVSGQSGTTRFQLDSFSPNLFTLDEVIGGTATEITPTAVGAPNGFARVGPGLVETGINQQTFFCVQVTDVSFNAVPGVRVDFTANGGGLSSVTVTTSTDGNGVATAGISFPTATAANVSAQAFNTNGTLIAGSALWTVTVRTTPVRSTDQLDFVPITTSGTGDVLVNVASVCNGLGQGTGGQTSVPTTVEYFFARDVSTAAEWQYDLLVRTISNNLTATSTFDIRVLELLTGVAQPSVVASTGALSANAGEQRLTGSFTQGRNFTASGTPANPRVSGFRVEIRHLTSTDASQPGIQVITDSAKGSGFSSFITAPGPVVFASFSSGRLLASQPDPRRR